MSPRKWRLLVELLLLFVAGPLVTMHLVRSPIPIILAGALLCGIILLRDPTFERRRLLNWAGARTQLPRIVLFASGVAIILLLAVIFWRPQTLFGLPRRHPLIWLLVMIFYPLLAVYGQEVIFRAFIFHRYRPLLHDDKHLVHLSAFAFGFAHIILHHPLTMLLTLLVGYLLGYTYHQSRSLLATALEHALYGCLAFTIGLGSLFYSGVHYFG